MQLENQNDKFLDFGKFPEEKQNELKDSKFFGITGRRYPLFFKPILKEILNTEYQYGILYLYAFKDLFGNVFTWITTKDLGFSKGLYYRTETTVKGHYSHPLLNSVMTGITRPIFEFKESRIKRKPTGYKEGGKVFNKLKDELLSKITPNGLDSESNGNIIAGCRGMWEPNE